MYNESKCAFLFAIYSENECTLLIPAIYIMKASVDPCYLLYILLFPTHSESECTFLLLSKRTFNCFSNFLSEIC